MSKIYLIFFLLFFTNLSAQSWSGVASQFSDSFVAWDVFQWEKEEVETDTGATFEWFEARYGTMELRWLGVKEDWTEWDYTLGDQTGTIRMKWKNDPYQWELRSYEGEIISMRTIWNADITQWRISDGDQSIDYKSRYTNDLGEWSYESDQYGSFQVKVLYTNDPRDWEIDDQLSEEISPAMKLAMVFISVFQSSPRE